MDVCDEFRREDFRLHGMLFTTINDISPHRNVSRQSKRKVKLAPTAWRRRALCGCQS
jgi:hypothetical protein